MKKLITLLFAVAMAQFTFAQAYDGTADYNKKSQAAVLVEYKYPQETVENALKDKLERQGLKLKSTKGYLVAYNSVISSINSAQIEYAFMVDRKSKREKETTVITLVMNIADVNATADNASKAKDFLNEMGASIDALNTENMIVDQTKILEKAEKKNKGLLEDISDLEKKIRKYQDELSKTKRDQEDQAKEVKRQQEILDTIKAKRK
jgi:hypothetical protein